jgi:predicted permease
MIYARGLSRSSEVAVRLSLGAGRWRVLRLFLAESVLFAIGATAVGAVLASASLRLFGAALPAIVTGARRAAVDFTPDAAVFGSALSAGAVGAIVIGLLTGWRAIRGTSARMLATAAKTSDLTPHDGRTRTALVAVQITAAVVLVIVAGLYLQNGPTVPDRKLGFDTTHVVTGRIVMDPRLDNATRRDVFADRLLTAARTLPAIEGVALAATIPAGVAGAAPSRVTLSADDGHGIANAHPKRLTAMYSAVSPGFFGAIGLRLLRGRDFGPSDAPGQPGVIILSRSAADELWPGEDPIGKVMVFNRGLAPTVVGVSEDPIVEDSESPLWQAANYCFVPLAQRADIVTSAARFLVFRSAAPEAAIDAMQAAVHAIDEDIALVNLAPLDRTMFESYAPQRAVRLLMSAVSALALGIALLGVYGVITYFVTARTREFGIRMALGATPRAIVKLVVDHAIHIVLVGLLVGVFVASVTTRIVEHEVFRTMPNGLATWIVVPLLVLATGVAAGFLPARRAAAVDPNVSLRE